MIITSLVDDYCPRSGLRGEHGLSLHIQAGGKNILFDAGQTDLFAENSKKLGIDLAAVDAFVLSHGHYDHGGGMKTFFSVSGGKKADAFAGSGYSAQRFARSESSLREIGVSWRERGTALPIPTEVTSIRSIAEGVFILPKADRVASVKVTERFRVVSCAAEAIDEFDDELSLAIVEGGALSIITGCAHRGIISIVQQARSAFPGASLKAIIGGFHLVDSTNEEAESVADALTAFNPEFLYCCHCTGVAGFAALSMKLGGKVAWLSCGTKLSL